MPYPAAAPVFDKTCTNFGFVADGTDRTGIADDFEDVDGCTLGDSEELDDVGSSLVDDVGCSLVDGVGSSLVDGVGSSYVFTKVCSPS